MHKIHLLVESLRLFRRINSEKESDTLFSDNYVFLPDFHMFSCKSGISCVFRDFSNKRPKNIK